VGACRGRDVQLAPTAASTHTAASELPRRLSSLTVPISFRRDTRCSSTRSLSFERLTPAGQGQGARLAELEGAQEDAALPRPLHSHC
jgi:hypothetical protein